MTMTPIELEQDALSHLEPILREQGYEFHRNPDPKMLPKFLKGIEPDAIATGLKQSLLIEVFQREGKQKKKKVRKLQNLLKGQDDWDLRVIYFSSLKPKLYSLERTMIRDAAHKTQQIADINSGAALLFAWSTLEAAARERMGLIGEHPLTAASLVNALASEGVISQLEAKELFEIAKIRNEVAHGQLNRLPTTGQLNLITGVIDNIQLEHSIPEN